MADSLTPSRRARLGPMVLEMLLIFVGVTAAFLVEDYRDRREAAERAVLLAGAIHQDIGDAARVQAALIAAIDSGLAAFDSRLAESQRPVPYVLEVNGSLRPPAGVWESAGEIGLRDFADPALLFELSFYYSELQGVAENFIRYSLFTEQGFWPVALSDTSQFYGDDGRIRGEFAAHVQQLRDYRSDVARQIEWGASLRERLKAAFPDLQGAGMAASDIYGSPVRAR